MNDLERAAFLESNLVRQLAWIAAADSKSPFIFALDTAILGFLAAVSPKSTDAWSAAPAFFATFTAIFGLASLLFLSFAAFPRTKGPKDSLIYFGDIAQRDTTQFAEAVFRLSHETHLADLAAQCHRNAVVASLKFKWVQRALVALYLSVPPWVSAFLLLYGDKS